MEISEEFTKFCIDTLEVNFGKQSAEIVNNEKSKKKLNGNFGIHEFQEFIDAIESKIIILSGKNKANSISNILWTKAAQLINEQIRQNSCGNSATDQEIDNFSNKNTHPSGAEILKHSEYTEIYRGSSRSMEYRIKDRILSHRYSQLRKNIHNIVKKTKLDDEINNFLTTFPQPLNMDIEDFIVHLRMMGFDFEEKELIEQIENEKLCRKFNVPYIFVKTVPDIQSRISESTSSGRTHETK